MVGLVIAKILKALSVIVKLREGSFAALLLIYDTGQVMDELGYLAIPPCLWGEAEEGLVAPVYLPYDANLTSIKRNNNTYTHYGEMASWQMRGVLAHQPALL